MKPIHEFSAERVLAHHCDELIQAASQPAGNQQDMHDFIAELCLALPEYLQGLLLGNRAAVSISEPTTQTGASLENLHRESGVHYLVGGLASAEMLVSFDGLTALTLTDRIFGGDGQTIPEEGCILPQSATLAVEQVVRKITNAYAKAIDAEATPATIATERTVARMAPFPRREYCISWKLTVAQDGVPEWDATVTFSEAALQQLLSEASREKRAASGGHSADAAGGAFGNIPLNLTATLADFSLSLSTLSALAPGQIIPLSIGRRVPLRVGERTLALGTIGTLEDRVALRLAQDSTERKPS